MIKRNNLFSLLMMTPIFIVVIIIAIYPLVYSIIISFSKSSLGDPFQSWIGFKNFTQALTGSVEIGSLIRSLIFAILSSLLAVMLGLIISLVLDISIKYKKFIRVILLLPLMTPPVMVGVIWKLMLASSGGFLNNILEVLNFISTPILFLAESKLAMLSLIIIDVWQWTPLCVLLIYTSIQSLPKEVFEAAKIDGAGVITTFKLITFPLLKLSLITALFLKIVISFKVFDLVFIITQGGPGLDTTVSSYNIYRTGLEKFNLGEAGAQTIVFIILVTLIITPLASFREKVHK